MVACDKCATINATGCMFFCYSRKSYNIFELTCPVNEAKRGVESLLLPQYSMPLKFGRKWQKSPLPTLLDAGYIVKLKKTINVVVAYF